MRPVPVSTSTSAKLAMYGTPVRVPEGRRLTITDRGTRSPFQSSSFTLMAAPRRV